MRLNCYIFWLFKLKNTQVETGLHSISVCSKELVIITGCSASRAGIWIKGHDPNVMALKNTTRAGKIKKFLIFF